MGGCILTTLELERSVGRIEKNSSQLTKVRRDVLPDPLGPISKIDGNVVKPLTRKTKKCRKSGIVRTRTMATARPKGEGLRRACASSADLDMIRYLILYFGETRIMAS